MIETERLRLRPWRVEDAEVYHVHTNTPSVMRWLGGVRTRTEMDESVQRLIGWQEAYGFTFWVVERKSDGAFLGFCGLKLADSPNSSVPGEVEIGWRFREDAWGQGYAKEAATASLSHAFERIKAERVIAITVNGNESSWGLMRRLGMKRREDLDYEDPRYPELNPAIIYEIERKDWLA